MRAFMVFNGESGSLGTDPAFYYHSRQLVAVIS